MPRLKAEANSVGQAVWLVVGMCALQAAIPTAAEVVPVGSEFQVNTITSGNERRPDIAVDGQGNFVVVWEGYTGVAPGVFGQRYDSTGTPRGTQFQINTYTTYELQWQATVAADEDGDFIVAWTRLILLPDTSFEYDVLARRFSSLGNPLGTEFRVNTYTHNSQYRQAVASDNEGNFVVVWRSDSQDGDIYGVFGQRFQSSGAPLGTEFQVNTYTVGRQGSVLGGYPNVATDPDGDFVVVWPSAPQDGSFSGIFGQRFASTGTPVGSEFQVNTYTEDWETHPTVSVDADGNFVVLWNSGQVSSDSEADVFGQRYDSSGAALGAQFQINTYTVGDQGGEFDAFGRVIDVASAGPAFVGVWQSQSQDSGGAGSGIFGKVFANAGGPIGSEFQVNSYTLSFDQFPAIAASDKGSFVVVWESSGRDGLLGGIFGQRFRIPICADGITEVAEDCDDGPDNGTGNSCCASNCQFKPNGNASCDGNACTRPDTCTDGVCSPGTCADGGVCTFCGGTCIDTGSACECQ